MQQFICKVKKLVEITSTYNTCTKKNIVSER